ncbi:MAG: hypothetical protein ACI8TA_000746, partial [Cyclobacteriaceae bacterium]
AKRVFALSSLLLRPLKSDRFSMTSGKDMKTKSY